MGKVFAVFWRLRYFGACVIVAGVLCYALLWAGVYRMRGRAIDGLERRLGCEIEAGRVSVGAGLWVDYSDVLVWERGRDRAHPLLRAARVRVTPDVVRALAGRLRVRHVALWSPELDIAPERDGTFRPEVWLHRTLRASRSAQQEFPGRVDIHDGIFLVHAIYNSNREASYVYADRVNGTLSGAGRGGDIGVRVSGRLWGSDFTLKGGVSPRRGYIMALRLSSDYFDFDRVLGLLREQAGGSLQFKDIPAGTGRLLLDIAGAPGAPSASGRVWLRDADAEFALRKDALELKNIRVLYNGRHMRGAARVDLEEEGFPFVVEVDAGKLDAEEMLARATGPGFAPRGGMSGIVRFRGRLTGRECCHTSGHITIKNGAFFMPFVAPGAGREYPATGIAPVPFETFDADFEITARGVNFSHIMLQGRGFNIRGRAGIDAVPDPEKGFDRGFAYNIDLSVSADEIKDMKGVAYAEYFSGRMKGRIRLDGDLRRIGATSGTLRFELHDGIIRNPFYQPEADEEPQTIAYDSLTAIVELRDLAFTLAGRLRSGGSRILYEGRVDPFGEMDLRAEAHIDDNLAGDLLGLQRYIRDDDDLFFDTTYQARIWVTGSLDDPVTVWTAPRITHADEEEDEIGRPRRPE